MMKEQQTAVSSIKEQLQNKVNQKTKPLGSLGYLEEIAIKIGEIQDTLTPELNNPHVLVFAADHGIAEDGVVNPFPQEVTWQMVYNFISEGAAINVFAKQNGLSMKVVDAGVKHDFEDHPNLIQAKVEYGTKNYLHQPAMTFDQCDVAIERGREIVREIAINGSNIIGFGEMGIGNTSAASLIMSTVLNIDIQDCVGSGTGLQGDRLKKKAEILAEVIKNRQVDAAEPKDILSQLGGYEIAMMCGAFLEASSQNMVVMVDGFIVTSALLIAHMMEPEILSNCLFAHVSHEQGHQRMLQHMGGRPILQLDLRLGEGTGVALAYPLVQAAVNFLNQMASFESAGVDDGE